MEEDCSVNFSNPYGSLIIEVVNDKDAKPTKVNKEVPEKNIDYYECVIPYDLSEQEDNAIENNEADLNANGSEQPNDTRENNSQELPNSLNNENGNVREEDSCDCGTIQEWCVGIFCVLSCFIPCIGPLASIWYCYILEDDRQREGELCTDVAGLGVVMWFFVWAIYSCAKSGKCCCH